MHPSSVLTAPSTGVRPTVMGPMRAFVRPRAANWTAAACAAGAAAVRAAVTGQRAGGRQWVLPRAAAAEVATTAPSQTAQHSHSAPKASVNAPTFQQAICKLQDYWASVGCAMWLPHNTEVGAGTMNPATFLRVLGPEPWNVCYAEPSIRPDDSRYGDNPNRLQRHTHVCT